MCYCMLEVVDVGLCLLEVPEVIRGARLCMLEAVDGGRCLLEVPDTLCATLYAGRCGRLALFAGGAGHAVWYSVCWRPCTVCCSVC